MDGNQAQPVADQAQLRAQRKLRKKQERKDQKQNDIRLLRRQYVQQQFAQYLNDPSMADNPSMADMVRFKDLTDEQIDKFSMQEFRDKVKQLKEEL